MGTSAINIRTQSEGSSPSFETTYVSSGRVGWRAESVVSEIQVPAKELHDEHSGEGDDGGLGINVRVSFCRT